MIVEPRAALDRLIAALDQHFAAATSGRGEDDPAYISAYRTLIDAFETYDEALYEVHGIDTPFLVYDDDSDDGVTVEEFDELEEDDEFEENQFDQDDPEA